MPPVPSQRFGPRYAQGVKVVRTSLIYMAGIVLGIAVGLWTASMTDDCPFSCVIGRPRFAAFECVVMGVLAAIAIPVIAILVNQDFPRETAESYRTVTRFLFEDLTRQREH
jgi:hypothetical protein